MRTIALLLSAILLLCSPAKGERWSANEPSERELSPFLVQVGLVSTAVSAACAVGSISALWRDEPNTTTGTLTLAAGVPTTLLGVTVLIKSQSRHDTLVGAMITGIGATACILGIFNLAEDDPDPFEPEGPQAFLAAPIVRLVGVTVGF